MDGIKYLAHINDCKEEQLLKDHLEGTAQRSGTFAEAFGMYDWGYGCGLLHDIGKYSPAFQERLKGSEKMVDHSTAGAKLCWEKGGMYSILSYCIAGHHAGLPDTGGESDTGAVKTLLGRMKKKIEDYQAFGGEIKVPDLSEPPFAPVPDENIDFFFSVLIRMLYSCLVDGDYLDTEEFMSGGASERQGGEELAVLWGQFNGYVSKWLGNQETDTINGRRTEILKNCLKMGTEEKGLFRLTVPTGGGKTVASLGFALAHGKKHKMSRVIYVIPYTSIIEQTAQIFRDILGEENVLENHCNIDYEGDEELKPMQLAAENWDKPVIVTTNVQFFESMFSNRSSKCRKLHNIANSVIIFDEAQMLPNAYLKPCVAAIEQLVRYYQCTAVLCTATQPALKKFLSEGMKGKELCPRMEEQFRFFRRVTMKDLGEISEEELAERLRRNRQALCIVNTKKKAQCIYRKICGGKIGKEGVYHLSTAMYPVHRRNVLEQIRKRLADGQECIVISTSLVEAGVDLDFPVVYRQLAGVDSIIQAAGRCNREGKESAEDSFTHIFRFDERESVPGQRQQIQVAESMLQDAPDLNAPETVEKYFEILYHLRGDSLDSKDILGMFRNMNFQFARAGESFRIIEENTKTILILREKEAVEILDEIRQKGFSKNRVRTMGQYCVNVYDNMFQRLYAAGLLRPISGEGENQYFVLTNEEQYSDEMGLELDVEYGQAVMM